MSVNLNTGSNLGTFAQIYVHDATAAAQAIATGATYTKLTGLVDNGLSANCTPDAANNKIIFNRVGYYKVSSQLSFSCNTNNVEFKIAAFVDGVEQQQAHLERKIGTASDVGSASFMGVIEVYAPGVEVDIRARHDNIGSVDLTLEYGQLVVEFLGEK